MKKVMLMAFVCGIAAFALTFSVDNLTARASATTYYVSPSGSDTNDGLSPDTAWRTISRVNGARFYPGDSILFEAGAIFSGTLYLGPGEGGTASEPITISSYGAGRATINGGTHDGILSYDTGGINIENLRLAGNGAGSGLNFYNDLSGDISLPHIYVTNVEAYGFRYGMALGGGNGGSGYNDIRVTSSVFRDNQDAGLALYGPAFNSGAPAYVNQAVYVGHVLAYNNRGDPNLQGSADSGNGIVLGSVSQGVIERSIAHDNGSSCMATACGVGIWAYDSTNVTVQYNESYDNHTGSQVDGDGFDFDQNTSNSVLQYNYSTNNDGSGFLLFAKRDNNAHANNTVRFNISQNDGRKNGYGSIELYGNIIGDTIYNNTVYTYPSPYGGYPTDIKVLGVGSGVTVRNNLFFADGNLWPVVVAASPTPAQLSLQRNEYYPFNTYWGTSSYASLDVWQQATGQELLHGTSVGLTAKPQLNAPGTADVVASADVLASLTQYHLQPSSPLIHQGLNLRTLFGVDAGSHDFYGTPLPGTDADPSVGAAQ